MKNLSNKKILQLQNYTIRASKKLMKKERKMIYKILTGKLFLNYIEMMLTIHDNPFLALSSLSLTNMHH